MPRDRENQMLKTPEERAKEILAAIQFTRAIQLQVDDARDAAIEECVQELHGKSILLDAMHWVFDSLETLKGTKK